LASPVKDGYLFGIVEAIRWLATEIEGCVASLAHCSRIAFTEWPQENQTPAKFRWYGLSWFFKPDFSNWKGVTMRIFTASVIVALSLGTPAFVQAQGAPSQPEAQKPPAQSGTIIRSIQVVDVKDLQPAVRSKVDEIVAQTSEKDIQALRKSIDATPEAASALKAKGLSSAQVVAINIAGGALTLFAKTAWNLVYRRKSFHLTRV
jgi:hypothetical protein